MGRRYFQPVRVVSGTAGGLRLKAPAGADTRPTTDKARGAIFSSLESMGVVDGARVLDLFAGSGALGIEALSRGAASATFVDNRADAIDAIETNLATTGLPGGTVVRADALQFLRGASPFDLALVDPPYDFDGWADVLSTAFATVVVLESDRELELGDRWEVLRRKRYGGTVVTTAQPADG
jgi:16S rRNA (guanine966-N2)-methyltransferase